MVQIRDNRSATSDQDNGGIYIQQHESKQKDTDHYDKKRTYAKIVHGWCYTVKFPLCSRADKSKEDLNKRQRYIMYVDCYYTSGPLI
jgi:hypothetical protein